MTITNYWSVAVKIRENEEQERERERERERKRERERGRPEYLGGHNEAGSLTLDLHISSQQTDILVPKRLPKVSEFLV